MFRLVMTIIFLTFFASCSVEPSDLNYSSAETYTKLRLFLGKWTLSDKSAEDFSPGMSYGCPEALYVKAIEREDRLKSGTKVYDLSLMTLDHSKKQVAAFGMRENLKSIDRTFAECNKVSQGHLSTVKHCHRTDFIDAKTLKHSYTRDRKVGLSYGDAHGVHPVKTKRDFISQILQLKSSTEMYYEYSENKNFKSSCHYQR